VADVIELAPVQPVAPAVAMQPGALRSENLSIGYTEPFAQELLPAWPWQPLAGAGKAATVELHAAGAVGLRLQFANLHTIGSLAVRVYSQGRVHVFGPFSAPSRRDDKTWWTPTVFGETIGVELHAPRGFAATDPQPQIIGVAYLNCECAYTPQPTLNCHNDISCSPEWKDTEGRGVARITFVGGGGGCGACTGALLNRQPDDLAPLLMTANHCVSTEAQADSLECFWFFETPSCNGSPPSPNTVPRTLGAWLLKRMASADCTLMGLYDPPFGDFYMGYDASGWDGSVAVGLHHPQGAFKRISWGDEDGDTNEEFCDQNGNNCFSADVWEVDYTVGTTEPGSSGSPIFQEWNGLRLVMGALSGGQSGCPDNTKYYGRLDLAYENLRYYMDSDDIASPVYVHGGVGGDGGNDGSAERGTSAQPFNTVWEGISAVRVSDTVQILPGTYGGVGRIWRPMTLTRWGTSGVVQITN
jgi:hypothetical protein